MFRPNRHNAIVNRKKLTRRPPRPLLTCAKLIINRRMFLLRLNHALVIQMTNLRTLGASTIRENATTKPRRITKTQMRHTHLQHPRMRHVRNPTKSNRKTILLHVTCTKYIHKNPTRISRYITSYCRVIHEVYAAYFQNVDNFRIFGRISRKSAVPISGNGTKMYQKIRHLCTTHPQLNHSYINLTTRRKATRIHTIHPRTQHIHVNLRKRSRIFGRSRKNASSNPRNMTETRRKLKINRPVVSLTKKSRIFGPNGGKISHGRMSRIHRYLRLGDVCRNLTKSR
ncbi:uncharacterized protein LOC113563009 isoform X2 [Ooceraea biroi]|uniref:uncharacterized protein LOC113563009 isoform X2 n=1 Tax=Ooceraea biroi TaxID=2015173 RepID=UPI000F08B646|nr:uncharacterized protein LOC113563009 isoform X2 [Ooceraea biroi]